MSEVGRDCERIRDLIPELATGVASGEERAEALAHLARCASCRAELEAIATVVDELLLLAPEREPPMGFETAVLQRLQTPRRGLRRSKVLMYAASVVVVGGLAAGGALWATADDRRLGSAYRRTLDVADGEYFAAADLVGPERADAGHLFAYEGSPSWIFVVVEGVAESGFYDVELVTEDGRALDLGRGVVDGGAGTWGRAVPVPVHDVLVVRMRSPSGDTLVARLASK